MQNASQKMHFFNSYLLTKKDEGDSLDEKNEKKMQSKAWFSFYQDKRSICRS